MESIKKNLDIPVIKILNDFEAIGYAVSKIDEEDYISLNPEVKRRVGETISIIGAGTGLGEAYLTKSPTSSHYDVYATEGGHTEFAAKTEEQWKLRNFALQYCSEKNKIEVKRVSIERLCSGPAIPMMYEFMRKEYPDLAAKSVL